MTVPNATPTYPSCPGPGPHTPDGKLFIGAIPAGGIFVLNKPFLCAACYAAAAPGKPRGPELPWPPSPR